MNADYNSILTSANNVARKGVTTHALDHTGDEVLLINGNPSPTYTELVLAMGFADAVAFLKECGYAISVYTLKAAGCL